MGVAALPRAPTSLKRILVVEDDPDTQIIVSFSLRRGDFVVEICGTGRDALARAQSFRPDLVLLDVMLPSKDGPAVLRELREDAELAGTPVIFMTARALPEEIAEFRRLGSLDVIVKPFDPMTLAESLDAIWARHHRRADGSDVGALREIEAAYLSDLGERVDAIGRAVRRLSGPRARAALDELYLLAHRLAGSSAILGFARVSDASRAVETRALALHRRRRRPSEQDRKAMASALRALRAAALQAASRSVASCDAPHCTANASEGYLEDSGPRQRFGQRSNA